MEARSTNRASPDGVINFDDYADAYDDSLQRGLQATGEDKAYFIRGRVDWLRKQLALLNVAGRRVLDYGCGRGDSCSYLTRALGADSYIGVDVSKESLRLAQARYGGEGREFRDVGELNHCGEFDVAYCNGVFHHIQQNERLAAMRAIACCVRRGGIFSLWENNPWNPGTRFVMRRIPFDRDAITITACEARQLLQAAGFEIERTTYHFYFPRVLRWLRGLEPALVRIPLGGQYQILARRSAAASAAADVSRSRGSRNEISQSNGFHDGSGAEPADASEQRSRREDIGQ